MSRIDLKLRRLPSKTPRSAHCAWALAALASVLISATHLHAQATVLTLGGGAILKPYSGYIDGNTLTTAKFSQPSGMALDPSGSYLFVADYTNNAVRLLSQLGNSSGTTTTFANLANGVSHPLAVVVDSATNIYILNHGSGNIGGVLKVSGFGSGALNVTTVTSTLTNATAMAIDGYNNLYVTVSGNKVVRISTNKVVTAVGTISLSGTVLQGIAVLDNGQLALCDAGNNGIWILNPANGTSTKFTGFHGAGDTLGASTVAAFQNPATIAKAGGGMLVVADCGNHKIKLVDQSGTVSLLYGVSSNLWVTGYGNFPGWRDGAAGAISGDAESRLPYGVAVAPNGNVYVSETYYSVIRQVSGTGLTGPQPGYLPQLTAMAGIGYDPLGNYLFTANSTNNFVQLLDLNVTTNATSTFVSGTTNGVQIPVAVLVDANETVYVLNQGTLGSGFIEQYDIYGNDYGPVVTGLTQPTAFTLDAYGTFFVTEQSGNIRAFGLSVSTTVVTIATNANVSLQGIALFDDGTIAASDAGNHVIWLVNPISKLVTRLTGQIGTSGMAVGTNRFAQLNQPHQLARVAGNAIIVADYGNSRLALVQRNGTLTTNAFKPSAGTIWFGTATDPVTSSSSKFVKMVNPFGVAAAGGGLVFDSETYYGDIRSMTGTGTTLPPSSPVVPIPASSSPAGIALNNEGTVLYVADTTNSVINTLNLADNQTATFLNSTSGINHPVDVGVDSSDNLYVLNQGTSGNGNILQFDRFGNLLATNAAGLARPTAMTFDSSGNILVSELAGAVQLFTATTSNTVATVTNAGAQLQGIALFSDGTIVASDAGHQMIWQIDPLTKVASRFTGKIDLAGTNFGAYTNAMLRQPHQIKVAGGDALVAADTGNNRIVVIGRNGSITNALISTNASVWFGISGDPFNNGSSGFVPMASPVGLAIGATGVFDSETYYDDIREIFGSGLSLPGTGSGGSGGSGSGTNITIIPPFITPNSGYYPMGRSILVQSPNASVYYTTDGSDPTTNSTPVTITGNLGVIHWFNSTNDLTWLRIKSFVGSNTSATISGQPVSAANLGVPQDFNSTLQAGIGSSIVIPIVCNLATNQQIRTYQFRFEISPTNTSTPTPTLQALNITPTNDFVPLVTAAQTGFIATNSASPYSLGVTNGLLFLAVGSGTHILFQHYAVVGVLEVQIPYQANVGDTFALNVLYPSATADAYNTPVPLTAMPTTFITVTNIPYTVGDSAGNGAWYNAGTFGDDNLDNSDVNQTFYAASGLRVPYTFSDVFNAMDVYPPDANGFVGGDGQIRFLDWVTILNRSLRLDPANWARVWSTGGVLVDYSTNLVLPQTRALVAKASQAQPISAPWYRQALLGASSVGYVAPGNDVYVPVYVKLADGSSLSGLQFRAVVVPEGNAPPLTTAPQLASAVATPLISQSFKSGETAFGWTLNTFAYSSRSSNFLAYIAFTVPTNAVTGQSYQVLLENADGAPSLTNQYAFETRSATVTVNAPATQASICSDEWKIHFFGSTTNPAAADNADPDGDGVPNWMEFLAGTDPTSAKSYLQLNNGGLTAGKSQSQMHLNWLTAPGHAYALQCSSSLAGGVWNTLATVSGDGTVTNCADLNPSSSTRYYRLYVLP